ncbi:MAG TPA: vWA domain-containing protein [Longimicrobium sp.]|jgi:Mg-chelatase subunit ChlD
MNLRLAVGILALGVAMALPSCAAGQADGELVRCDAARAAPCVQMRLSLALEEASAANASTRWSGAAGAIGFREVDVRPVIERPLTILALVDVSGSMAGAGLEHTRSALRTFLRDLSGSAAEVAVAPFGSRDVAAGIQAARFGTPAEAEAQLDRLPAPAGNTGLYSAVQAGVELLAGRLRAAPEKEVALLVLTDGRNDVGKPEDEPGLLAGAEGRERAVDAVRRSGVPVWVVGIGSGVDQAELAALAGPLGRAHVGASDSVRLARTLGEIRGALATKRAVTAVLPASSRSRLARGEAVVRVESGALFESRDFRWRPPLMALPAFAGVATPSRPLVTAADEPRTNVRLVTAFFATLLALLWWVVPALIWPVQRPLQPAVRRRGSRRGVRPGVQEAPPRRPSDITAAVAQRIVVHS